MQRLLCVLDVRFRRRDLAIPYLCYLTVVAFAFRYFGLMLERLDTRFLILDRRYVAFLFVPPCIQLITLFLEFG